MPRKKGKGRGGAGAAAQAEQVPAPGAHQHPQPGPPQGQQPQPGPPRGQQPPPGPPRGQQPPPGPPRGQQPPQPGPPGGQQPQAAPPRDQPQPATPWGRPPPGLPRAQPQQQPPPGPPRAQQQQPPPGPPRSQPQQQPVPEAQPAAGRRPPPGFERVQAEQEAGGARPKGQQPLAPVVSGGLGSLQRQVQSLTLSGAHDFPRPQTGTLGRRIQLIANHFKVDLPRGSVFHYDVDIRAVKKPKNGKGPEVSEAPRVGVKPEGLPRKLNANLCRQVIEQMLEKYKLKRTHWPAYDGNKNLYTRKRLPITDVTQFTVDVIKTPGDEGSLEKFQVTIKPAQKEETGDCEVSLEPLHEISAGRVMTYPEEAVLALDIILRYGPSLKMVPVGRSFFTKPRTTEEVVLEEGRAIWFGYYQSLRPGWKPLPNGFVTNFYLNIDKSATAFLRPMNLLDFVFEVLHVQRDRAPPVLSLRDIIKLNKELKGIQVQALHLKYPRKYKIVKVLRDEKLRANTHKFVNKGKDVTVEQYLRETYQRNIRYANYPLIHVGDPKKEVYLPMEVLQITDGQPSRGKLNPNQQAEMVAYTAVPPRDRFEEIYRYNRMSIENSKEYLKEFDINISQDPVQFAGRVLPAPNVEYQGTKVPVREGQWEMRGKNFIRAQELKKWVILSLSPTRPDDIMTFVSKLKESGANLGMHIQNPCAPPGQHPRTAPGGVKAILEGYKRQIPDLEMAVVILPKNSNLYKEVKHEGETNVGLITQCVTDENMRKCKNDKFSFRFLMNICQKINAKLGGTNVSLQREDKPHIFRSPVIIIGADVTHPAPGAQDGYSIAACVGSVDAYPAKYVTKIKIQKVHKEARAREERILELADMIKDLLKAFYRATKHKPDRIVFFRDGVSEGQFLQVRNYELLEIRKACTSLEAGYEPKISFIVVQKRHHTRFAPQNFRDGLERYKYNVPAGTTVDTEITNPSYFNFFLASHVALQGTTRPAHYTVLWDDNDFNADTLQKFVFYLCHTYNRCTRSISIPPPVMYADLAAYRAKLYIDAKSEQMSATTADSDSSSESLLEEYIRTIVTTDNVKNEMYFV